MRSARWGMQRRGEGKEKGRELIGTETLVGFLSCSSAFSASASVPDKLQAFSEHPLYAVGYDGSGM